MMANRQTLQIEQLEKRIVMAGNITAVALPQLDGETALIAEPLKANPRIIVAGAIDGTPFLGTAPLTENGELKDDISIDPVFADIAFAQAESGLDIAGRQRAVSFIPGSFEGHPALFDLTGTVIWSDSAVAGEISLLYETPQLTGLVNKTDGGQQLMFAQGVSVEVPTSVQVASMLKPIEGETTLYLGGTNAQTGRPTILKYDLVTQSFAEPDDIILLSEIGSVKGLARAADASGEPIAIVEIIDALPGNVPAVGSVWINNREKTEVFGASNGGKVIAEMGITIYQGAGDWFVHVGSKTMANLTGLPRGVPIPLSGLLADAGFGDTTVKDVTSVITDGLGRLYIVTDIEVQGYQMVSVLSVFDPSPLMNKIAPLNTTNNGNISPLDALVVINYLNATASQGDRGNDNFGNMAAVGRSNLAADDARFSYLDVNGDNFISPLDALMVINYLNNNSSSGEGEVGVQNEVGDLFSVSSTRVAALVPNLDLMDYFKRRRLMAN